MIHFSNKKYIPQQDIIAFDLDSTLVSNVSGKKFPVDEYDFQFTELFKTLDNYDNIVVFTNQSYNDKKREIMIRRVINIINCFPKTVGCVAFIADKLWKKPFVKMLDEYFNLYPYDKYQPHSITYIGDAAGRPNDFSDTDRKFAFNMGIYCKMKKYTISVSFQTPELFLGLPDMDMNEYTGFNGIQYLQDIKKNNTVQIQKEYMKQITQICIEQPTLIICVGPPGSGKTILAHRLQLLYNDLVIIDEMPKTKKIKIIQKTQGSMISSQTNPSDLDRQQMIEAAPNHNVIIIYWDNIEIAKHNNYVRYHLTGNLIPNIAYSQYQKKLNVPDATYLWKFDGTFRSKEEAYYFIMKF